MSARTHPATAADDAVLAARAAQLARPLDDQDTDTLDLLLVSVGEQSVAVPVEHVSGVQAPGAVAQVPGTGGVLTGMAAAHGAALVVAGLAALLGLPYSGSPDEQWVVVLHDPHAPLGLLVDAAVDIVTVGHAQLSSSPAESGLVRALLPDGSLVLDIPVLLRDPRLWLTPPEPEQELPWHPA